MAKDRPIGSKDEITGVEDVNDIFHFPGRYMINMANYISFMWRERLKIRVKGGRKGVRDSVLWDAR